MSLLITSLRILSQVVTYRPLYPFEFRHDIPLKQDTFRYIIF